MDVGKHLFAVIIAVVSAIAFAVVGFTIPIMIGAKFFSGEASYGVGLAFCVPTALVFALVAFAVTYWRLTRGSAVR